MSYTPSFTPTYPGGWEDRPSDRTPAYASTFNGYDSAITNIETFLDGSTAIKPVSKTTGMTQQVGVDENGALYTAPSGGGGGGAAEDITYDNTQSGLTADDVQEAIDELAASGGGTAEDITYDNTTSHLTADNVQEAVDEVVSNVSAIASNVNGKVSKSGDSMTGSLSIQGNLTLTGTGNITANGDIAAGSSGSLSGQKILAGYNNYVNMSGVANGYQCNANTDYSHAEGNMCSTSGSSGDGSYAHAEGNQSQTYADYSHAEGEHTEARGIASHTEGYYTLTEASYAHAEGNHTVAQSDYQLVCGEYNSNDYLNLFEVGNGDYDYTQQEYVRSNAFEVRKDGSVKVGTEIDCDTVSTLASTDYVYVSVYDGNLDKNILKKITIANLKTVLGI